MVSLKLIQHTVFLAKVWIYKGEILNVADGRRKKLLNKRLTITDAITEDAAIEDRREADNHVVTKES